MDWEIWWHFPCYAGMSPVTSVLHLFRKEIPFHTLERKLTSPSFSLWHYFKERTTRNQACICWRFSHVIVLLPPASEGWREVIFSLCVSVHTPGGGYLPSGWGGQWGGTYLPRSGLGGGLPTFQMGPGLDRGGGFLPSQVCTGGGGTYLSRSGWGGTYLPRQGDTYPRWGQ